MTSKKMQTITIMLMIIAISIMSIAIVMYNITVSSIKQELESAYRSSLQNSRERVEAYFRSIDQLTLQFEKMPEVAAFTQGNTDPVVQLTVLNQAYRLHAALDYVDNILLYHNDRDISISTNLEISRKYSDFTPLLNQFVQLNTDKAFIKTELDGIPITVFMRKLPVFSQAQTLTIMFQINGALFDQIMGNSSYDDKSSYFIMDEAGQVIANRGYYSNDAITAWAEQIDDVRAKMAKGTSNVLSLEDAFITYLSPSYNGWSYAIAVSNRSFLHRAEEVRNVVLLISLSLFAAAALLSFASTQWLWRGWYKIKSLLDNTNETTTDVFTTHNEFNNYLAKLQTIVKRGELLKRQRDEMLPPLKEALSLSLLENGAKSSEILERAKQYDIRITEGSYCCFCIVNDYVDEDKERYSAWDRTTLEYAVLLAVKEVIDDNAWGFAVNSPKGHIIVMLSSAETNPEPLQEVIAQVTGMIRGFIKQYFPITTSIGVSNIRSDLSLIKECYEEALEALHQKHLSTGDQIFYSADVREPAADELLCFQQIETELIPAVLTRNKEQAYHIIESLYALKACENIQYKWFQNKMIKLTELLNLQLKQQLKNRDDAALALDKLLQLVSLEEWVRFLKGHFIDRPIEELESQHQANIQLMTTRLREYIADYVEADLQLADVCKALHIPVSSAKQALKEQLDATFSELVLHARVEQSKSWLTSEDYSIDDIARRLHYSNAQNFSRTFKKMVGVPPGQYRVNTRVETSDFG